MPDPAPRAAIAAALALALLAAAGPAAAGPVQAGPGSDDPDPTSRTRAPTLRAKRLTGRAPDLDGRLDDPAWAGAAVADGFTQYRPAPGDGASERTEARVLYDDEAIYVGMRMYDDAPSGIAAQLGRRDARGLYSDWAHVLIDSYFDRRTAFRFSVNPRGVQKDVLHFDDTSEDVNWDGVWEAATSVDGEGWVAEFRIPLSQLRFSGASCPAARTRTARTAGGGGTAVDCDERIWGVNFGREIARRSESDWWAPILPDEPGMVSVAGELRGIRELEPPRRLEVLPYVVAQGRSDPVAEGNPFQGAGGREAEIAVGGDLKYGLTSDLTLSATINPDFGQVEADPSVVNLTAQETFYSEKRPFFTEGANIFAFDIGFDDGSGEGLFYTRRIGRSPQRGLDGEFSDVPVNTTILGAAKVSGRTAGGWSIGFLDALTSAERGRTYQDGVVEAFTVEPLTNYGVARVTRDFRDGRSGVGGIVTSTHRRLDGDQGLAFLTDQAYAGAVDFRHRSASDAWDLSGWLAGSHVLGDTAAIQRLQLGSSRYYQRPDAEHLRYDPTATSLSGYAGAFNLWKVDGNWRGGMGVTFRSPGFEVNDAGFQTSADLAIVYGNIRYHHFETIGPFRRFTVGVNPSASWDFGGVRQHTQINLWSDWDFRNDANIGFWSSRALPAVSTGSLRGGPAIRRPGAWRGNVWAASDPRQPVRLGVWTSFGVEDEHAGWYRNGGVDVTWRPSGQLDLRLGPSVHERSTRWQYVGQPEDDDAVPHYVFAGLRQRTFSLTTRASYAFTPTLSLQLYAQPFVAAGAYHGFREVTAPRADAFADRFHDFTDSELTYVPADPGEWGEYAVDRDGDGAADYRFGEPDFSFKELRSNVVLRWEYRAGSTLYVVWSQGRSRTDPTGAFRVASDLGDLLEAPGRNVLAVKLNYWLDL